MAGLGGRVHDIPSLLSSLSSQRPPSSGSAPLTWRPPGITAHCQNTGISFPDFRSPSVYIHAHMCMRVLTHRHTHKHSHCGQIGSSKPIYPLISRNFPTCSWQLRKIPDDLMGLWTLSVISSTMEQYKRPLLGAQEPERFVRWQKGSLARSWHVLDSEIPRAHYLYGAHVFWAALLRVSVVLGTSWDASWLKWVRRLLG